MNSGQPPEGKNQEGFLDKVEEALHIPELEDARTGLRLPHWLRRILLVLLTITLLPVIIFQIPWVQTWAAHQMADKLSHDLQTTVSVDRVWLGLFSNISLQGLYIEDRLGDTLLYANQLDVNHGGLLDLFSRRFDINSLHLKQASLRLHRPKGSEEFNFQFLLDYFLPKSTDKPFDRKPIRLNLRNLYLDDVAFSKPDEELGKMLDARVGRLEAHFRVFDPEGKRLVLSSLDIWRPHLSIVTAADAPVEPDAETNDGAQLVSHAPADTALFRTAIGRFTLREGTFSLHNYQREPVRLVPDSLLDFRHLDLSNIEIKVRNFNSEHLDFFGQVDRIACQSSTGFTLEQLSAQQAAVTCSGLELYGLQIKTPDSYLGDTLIFKYDTYSDWQAFTDGVDMQIKFKDTEVKLADLIEFVPALQRNSFFAENRNELVRIEGLVRGPVNRLDGRKLVLDLADDIHLEGSFSTRNLAVPDEQFLHLDLQQLHTSTRALRKLLPRMPAPQGFDRLGALNFRGRFDGFFNDFVADGRLQTSIGRAEMFMNLKVSDDRRNATYSGDLFLKDFDLAALTQNPNFGKVGFNVHVKQGSGLTLDAVNTSLEGTIDSFEFKGYKYRDVALNGHLEKNIFDGFLQIQDPNVELLFQGKVNFAGEVPVFNFNAQLDRLEPQRLNLVDEPWFFSGNLDLNLQGLRLADVTGEAWLKNFLVVKNRKDSIYVDEGFFRSAQLDNGEKVFQIASSIGEADLRGRYDIEALPQLLQGFLVRHFPRFSSKFGLKAQPSVALDSSSFTYEIRLKELQNLFALFEENIEGFDETSIVGHFDGPTQDLLLEVDIPEWRYATVSFRSVYLKAALRGDEGLINLGVIETRFDEDNKIDPVTISGNLYGDTLDLTLVASNFYKILDNVSIDARLTLDEDDTWFVQFLPGRLAILNEPWDINPNNYLRIGAQSVETRNFILSNGDRQIILQNVRNEGLQLQLNNYPLQSLEPIRNLPRHRLEGLADLQLRARNIFQLEGLSLLLRIDSLRVNGDEYGVLRLDASAPDPKQSVSASLSISDGYKRVVADGYYNPPNFEPRLPRPWISKQKNYLDFSVTLEHYPLEILEYFIEAITDVRGEVDAEEVHFHGPPDRLVMQGTAQVSEAAFKLIPLQTTYFVPSATVKLTEYTIDGTGQYAYDKDGNRVLVQGGLTHDHLKNLGVNVRLTTDPNRPFLAMATTERDNPVFYGTAYGTGYVTIEGSLKQPELYANGRSMPGTHIVIPLEGSVATTEVGFISFERMHQDENEGAPPLQEVLRGLNMTFDLQLTEDAFIELIFDRAYGDVIKGTGNGTLQVIMKRDGEFKMYGTYTVASGEYLFTLMNLGFNKAFTVTPGGVITWSGDPYNASIDIDAVYEGINTSVYSFVEEYLTVASTDLQNRARTATPVRLRMKLKGNLFSPEISFDFDFPSLDSELRSLAENKLRLIQQNPNELNRQVFGLLVLGQFLPNDFTINAGEVTINTLSEMLANQLSIYFTEFISELFTGRGIIQSIDLDLSYSRYGTTSGASSGNIIVGNEVQGRVKVYLSDRFSIRASGNFEVGPNNDLYLNNNGLVAHEFVIEYALTKDRRLKVRAYQSSEPDIGGGQRIKYGGGLSFRKEFDSLSELLGFLKKRQKSKNKQPRED